MSSSSSSSTGTSTSSTPSPTNTGNSGGSITNSASLYLYTFLATLVLLLGVSAAIVVRSLVLRRRHRRMIEEAIRNGTYVPPSVLANSRGRIDPSMKPKLWEATVHGDWAGGEKGGWRDVFPISASFSSTPVTVNSSSSDSTADPNAADGEVNSRSTLFKRLRVIPAQIALGAWHLISPAGRRPTDPESNNIFSMALNPPNKQPTHQTLPSSDTTTPTHMEVAVLIAMPGALAAAAHRAKTGGEDEDLPHVEVGLAEVVIPPTAPSSMQEYPGTERS